MSHHKANAKVKQVKGRVKEAVGIVTGNREMEKAGSRQRAEGATQEKTAQMRRQIGDLFAKAAKRIKD